MNTLFTALSVLLTSIYSLSFTASGGSAVSFRQYQGKKILLVNVATNSPRASQLGELQQLQAQFADSLVIVAFPSNSFGRESRSDSAIRQFCRDTYHTGFAIAQKGDVKGPETGTVYRWLADVGANGVVSAVVQGDFQKFLLDEEGNVVGVFAPNLSPLDPTVKEAVRTHYN